jgi:hypothetical protein
VMATRVAGNGDSDKGGRQAMATAMKRAMVTTMRVVGNEEDDSNGGKSDGDGNKGGR